jgi:hypothetical protein
MHVECEAKGTTPLTPTSKELNNVVIFKIMRTSSMF